MNPTHLHQLLEQYGLRPHRERGQNFLTDQNVIDRIVSLHDPVPGGHVLEIGPGAGSLSGELVKLWDHYTGVEFDQGLFRLMEEEYGHNDNVKLVHGDFLKVQPPGPFGCIISNLPYYCASEMIFTMKDHYPGTPLVLMMQKEMAARLTADSGSADYGAMTVMLYPWYNVTHQFHVKSGSFYPRPDVVSTVVTMVPLQKVQEISGLFARVVKSAFWGRRKTLVKALVDSPHGSFDRDDIRHACVQLGIDPSVRGEQLSPGQFMDLARALEEICRS